MSYYIELLFENENNFFLTYQSFSRENNFYVAPTEYTRNMVVVWPSGKGPVEKRKREGPPFRRND